MEYKMGSLLMMVGFQAAMGYQTEIRSGNAAEAAKVCQALLGDQAKIAGVQHFTGYTMGKVEGHTFHYVVANCTDPALTDCAAAEILSRALSNDANEIVHRAVTELTIIKFYSSLILARATRALDISYVHTANELITFLSHAGTQAIPYLVARLQDPDAAVRYKVTYTLYSLAYEGHAEALLPFLPALEHLYDTEDSDGFMKPYPRGTKFNVVRILGFLGKNAPLDLVEKVIAQLDDVLFAADFAYVSYSGDNANFGKVAVEALGRLGATAVPAVGAALLKNDGGNFLNGESNLLLAAEEMGASAKPLIPILRQILAGGKSYYPARVQKTLDKLEAL